MKISRGKLEDKIYKEQEEYIEKEYGKDAANKANYGWGVNDNEDSIEVATKVYGIGILNSTGFPSTGEIDHDFEEFGNPNYILDLITMD